MIRLLSFLIAPDIAFRHCLCITGYSFFSWSIALILSHLCDLYKTWVPAYIPLAAFGLPSAIAIVRTSSNGITLLVCLLR